MSAFLVALLFMHSEAFAQEYVGKFDFNGAWQLERTENFDAKTECKLFFEQVEAE
jgi:hypothetical protein